MSERKNWMPMDPSPSQIADGDLPVEFGRYELLEIVGKGGMGRVFRAILKGPAGFRKEVAVKMLLAGSETVSRSKKNQLAHEARLGGMLRHPNIVDTYELGEAHGDMFISMEFIQGISLSRLVFREQGLPPAAALDVLLQVAAALDHAHGLQINGEPVPLVHRDLKPANILVDRTGMVKITDFGIAILRRSNHVFAEAVSGTLRYMSPEQITGAPLGPPSDLFAFGIIAFELLLGQRLFPKAEPKSLARLILNAEHTAQHHPGFYDLDTQLPGICKLILDCLRKRPVDRVRGAEALFERMRIMRPNAPGESLLQVLPRHVSNVRLMHMPALMSSTPTDSRAIQKPLKEAPTQVVPQNHNLPSNLSPLIGRGTLLKEVTRQIKKKGRVITLKGPGGIGKSIAALHFLQQTRDQYSGGSWYFDLGGARDEEAIMQIVAQELKLPLNQGDVAGSTDQIGRNIAAKNTCVLLFDSIDQVSSPLKKAIAIWREKAPECLFIITSRSPLKAPDERVIEVMPLGPKEALDLFRERARHLKADAHWQEELAPEILARLEGNPLAIELAASRLYDLSGPRLLEELQHRFAVLSDTKNPSGRQATLHATIDWSWKLLNQWEAASLAQLSIFRGSFTIEAADAVLDLSEFPESPWPMDILQSLLDRSLVQAVPGREQPRFRLSDSIREYAQEKASPVQSELERRFILHFSHIGTPEQRTILRSGGPEGRAKIRDSENLFHAFDLALQRNSPQAILCFLGLVEILERTGPVSRILELSLNIGSVPLSDEHSAVVSIKKAFALIVSGKLEEANRVTATIRNTAKESRNSEIQSEALLLESTIMIQRGKSEGIPENARRGIQSAREALNNELVARWLTLLGRAQRMTGHYPESASSYREAAEIARQLGDQTLLASNLGNEGTIALMQGNLKMAVTLFGQSLAVATNSGDRRIQAVRIFQLGTALLEAGELDSALEDYQKARTLFQELGELFNESMVLIGISQVHYTQDHYVEARILLFESIRILEEIGSAAHSGIALTNLGEVEIEMGLFEHAEDHLTKGLQIAQKSGSHRVRAANQGALGRLYLKQGKFSEAKVLLDKAEQSLREREESTELGKLLCSIAEYHAATGASQPSTEALKEAESIAKRMKTAKISELSKRIRRVKTLQDQLPPES